MTNNELIAEFMGIKVAPYKEASMPKQVTAIVPEEGCIDWPELNVFMPDKDWNQLMPVVEKIYRINIRCDKERLLEMLSRLDKAYNDFSVIDRIGPVHKAVIEFIKWYNINKSK